jgi:hypothetical protein
MKSVNKKASDGAVSENSCRGETVLRLRLEVSAAGARSVAGGGALGRGAELEGSRTRLRGVDSQPRGITERNHGLRS